MEKAPRLNNKGCKKIPTFKKMREKVNLLHVISGESAKFMFKKEISEKQKNVNYKKSLNALRNDVKQLDVILRRLKMLTQRKKRSTSIQ